MGGQFETWARVPGLRGGRRSCGSLDSTHPNYTVIAVICARPLFRILSRCTSTGNLRKKRTNNHHAD
jgi:hypothetical protein